MSILGQFQFRRDSAANWTSENPILLDGEMGIESDTDKFKLGDGSTAWASLSYGGIKGDDGADGADGSDGADGVNGTNGADGSDGADGVDGASAYEIAVANGFSGDEVAWLASLVGADGADGADGTNGTNGTNGTDGADGSDGADGADGADGDTGWSPILAVGTDGERRVLQVIDWTGGTGTEPAVSQYIGASGFVATAAEAVDIRGSVGADGDDGDAGEDGLSAYEIAVANGFSGDETAWLASLVGEDGAGDVVGPSGSADGRIALFDGTTGKLLKQSAALLSTIESILGDCEEFITKRANALYFDADNGPAWDASGGAFPAGGGELVPTKKGGFFNVTTGGTVDGITFVAGDVLVCLVDSPSSSTYAENWLRILGDDSGGGGDAGDITYTPDTTDDWNSTDPGNVDGALDALANRVASLEVAPDPTYGAESVAYTPITAADWDGETDPGNVNGALDQLAERTKDLEDAGGGDALVGNPLSQFAATTSSQLAGVISDETGSGALVFATSPTLVTPALGTPSSGTLTNCTGLPEAGLLDDAVTLAKMAAGTAGNLITYDASGNPAAVATGTATHVLTSNGAGAAPTFQAAAGGGGLTDFTETLHTASPNNTVNAAELAVTGGTTNVDVVITPKGTGAFILGPEPDGTSTGGNKRGARAVDLQTSRNAATKVGSGEACIQQGKNNTTSSASAATFGEDNTTSGSQGAFTVGHGNTNSCKQGVAMGGISTVTGEYNQTIGYSNSVTASACANMMGQWSTSTAACSTTLGTYAANTRNGTLVFAADRFSGTGDAQFSLGVMRATTTNATPTELFLNTVIGGSNRFTIPASGIIAGTISLVGARTDGSAVAHYVRQFCLKNVAGTTSEVYAPVTIGTDNAAGTSIAVTANDTNDALKIEVTGIAAQNWRWHAVVFANDIKYTS